MLYKNNEKYLMIKYRMNTQLLSYIETHNYFHNLIMPVKCEHQSARRALSLQSHAHTN